MIIHKNKFVEYKYSSEKLGPYLLGVNTKRPHNPLVEFFRDDKENKYSVRAFALIPNLVEHIHVIGPKDRKDVKTIAGVFNTRTITIKWENNIKPDASTAFNLWVIDVEYHVINPTKEIDNAIKVVYEYGDPKLSRGTVTTTGTPPASDTPLEVD